MRTFDISRFTISHGTLVAEASSLELPIHQYPTFVGIREAHGNVVIYSYQRKDYDQNAHYLAINPTDRVRLTIFND